MDSVVASNGVIKLKGSAKAQQCRIVTPVGEHQPDV